MSQQVFSGAEEEFRYQRYQRIFLCKHVFNPIPPPFNMPIHAFAILRLCSGLLLRVCSGLLSRLSSHLCAPPAARGAISVSLQPLVHDDSNSRSGPTGI